LLREAALCKVGTPITDDVGTANETKTSNDTVGSENSMTIDENDTSDEENMSVHNVGNETDDTANNSVNGGNGDGHADGGETDDDSFQDVPKMELTRVQINTENQELFDLIIDDDPVDPLAIPPNIKASDSDGDDGEPIELVVIGDKGFPMPIVEDDHGLIKRENDIFSGNKPYKELVSHILDNILGTESN
jgi:hypothetical protein